MPLAQYIYQQAPLYGVDPNLALGIASAESGSANGALNGNPDSGGMSFGPFQLFFSSGNPFGNNSPSVGTGFVNTYGVAPNASNWQQQVDYSLQTMAQPGGLRNWSTYNNQGSNALTASGQNIASSMGLSSSRSNVAGTNGDSLSIDPDSPDYGDITGYSVAGVNAPLDTTPGSSVSQFGSNDEGTPSLGGGIAQSSEGLETGTSAGTAQYMGGGQPINITDLKGLGTDVEGAGKNIQSGAQNAATGITGTLASAINSLENYTSNAFVVAALVVLGLILVSYGLGLFGKRTLASAGI